MSTPWFDYPTTNGYSTTAIPGNWDSPHYAIDIGTPMDTPITDLLPGVVTKADYAPWGGEVFVRLGNGLQEYFYHLDQIAVNVGQNLSVGQLVGLSGGQTYGGSHPTGSQYSSGPHTHFGITNGSVVPGPSGQQYSGIDPTPIITAARNGTLTGIGNGGIDWGSILPGPFGLSPSAAGAVANAASNANPQAAQAVNSLNQIGTFAGNVNTAISHFDYIDFGIRAALIIVGLIIVIGGLYLFAS